MNNVNLVGRVGQDPEIKYIESGRAVLNLSLATSDGYKDKNTGERVKNTEWHTLVFWAEKAELVSNYVKKGDILSVSGKLVYDKYEDKEGNKRERAKIQVFTLDLPPKDAKANNNEGEDDLPW